MRTLPLLLGAAIAVLSLVVWILVDPGTQSIAPAAAPGVEASSDAPLLPPVAGPEASPSATGGRAVLDAEEPESPSPGGSDASLARLVVRVVSADDGEPVAGMRIVVKHEARRGFHDVDGSHAAPGEAPRTGEDGRAVLDIESGMDLEVSASSTGPLAGGARRDVPGLAAGATHEVTLAVRTALDGVFYGRVVADEDGRPLPGAVIRALGSFSLAFGAGGPLHLGSFPEARTNAEGEFALPCTTWRGLHGLCTAEDRAPAIVLLGAERTSETERAEIRLRPAAGIDGSVHGAGPGDLRVRLESRFYTIVQKMTPGEPFTPGGALVWNAVVDATGTFRFDELPPGVPLTATLSLDEAIVYEPPAPLTLAPGERRTIQWHTAAVATVEGRAVERDDRPAAGLHLWLVPAAEVSARYLRPSHDVVQQAVTDDEGRFVFDAVAPGEWVVGPRPSSSLPSPSRRAQAAAPVAERVTITPDTRTAQVLVRVHRGLYLGGRTVGPGGEAVAPVSVHAWGLDGGGSVSARTENDGTFVLGPLLPGRYSLSARGMSRLGFAGAEAVEVEAGTMDAVLTMVRGGALAGRTIDAATGEEVAARVGFYALDQGRYSSTALTLAFSRDGLMPGTYDLTARSDDGRVGALRAVEVVASVEKAGLEIPVTPGGYLVLAYEGPAPYATFTVVQDGVRYGLDNLRSGTSTRLVVPVGAVTVRVFAPDRLSSAQPTPMLFDEERRLQITAGQELEASFAITDG